MRWQYRLAFTTLSSICSIIGKVLAIEVWLYPPSTSGTASCLYSSEWRTRLVTVMSFSLRGLNHTTRDTFLQGKVRSIHAASRARDDVDFMDAMPAACDDSTPTARTCKCLDR
jgi:hypothetical protein